ncbi:hypothetical protein QJS66_03870 [Kocuria rhizophila]|nr:hypothetical protein QJS66_03870 [Kocuria rhizophila]
MERAAQSLWHSWGCRVSRGAERLAILAHHRGAPRTPPTPTSPQES